MSFELNKKGSNNEIAQSTKYKLLNVKWQNVDSTKGFISYKVMKKHGRKLNVYE